MGDAGTLSIDFRFRGPPDSGNGGYVCGHLARLVDGDARVRLEIPPPLERPLALRRTAAGAELLDADRCVARAWPAALELELPRAPGLAEATRAAEHFRGFRDHVFPGCFVCGPERGEGDGLRIFPGPVADAALVAAPWQPDASLGEPRVRPEFVWAALDCAGCFAFPQPAGRAVLLGELWAHLELSPRCDEPCVVVGWEIAHEGRKHRTGTALFDADGRCAGYAAGIWIEVPRP